jgi:hypothetical protein
MITEGKTVEINQKIFFFTFFVPRKKIIRESIANSNQKTISPKNDMNSQNHITKF